jgi:hypothetical protein
MVQGFRARIKYGLLKARSGPLYHLVFCSSPGVRHFFFNAYFFYVSILFDSQVRPLWATNIQKRLRDTKMPKIREYIQQTTSSKNYVPNLALCPAQYSTTSSWATTCKDSPGITSANACMLWQK